MQVRQPDIDIQGLAVIEPVIYTDSRGQFSETFNSEFFKNNIENVNFVSGSESVSHKNVIRGLHYQNHPYSQSKLVRCVYGNIIDVAVDLRKNSVTFGKHFKIELSGENKLQLFIPKGFAHGFLVLSDIAIVYYQFDAYYNSQEQAGVLWNDLGIDWGVTDPIISDKDRALPRIKDL